MIEGNTNIPDIVSEIACGDNDKIPVLLTAYAYLFQLASNAEEAGSREKIRTIEGFISSLVKRHPWLAPENSLESTPMQILGVEIEKLLDKMIC